MYYLANFCRICIKTDVDLVDVDSDDVDSIKLQKKLEECTEMVINRESLSTKICTLCIKKLRISYEFHNMCKRSTSLLQGLLTELMSNTNKITADNFMNSEIRVSLSQLKISQHNPRKRITKTERCSILKSLLSQQNSMDNTLLNNIQKGGLKDIIAFTKNFDFGYMESNECSTPLSKLVQFSEDFFKRDFTAFQETVLFIIENNNCIDDEEQMFDIYPEEIKKEIPFEEVVVEPDIRVKTELFENEEELDENFNCDTADDELHHSELMRDENINESIDQINYKNISSYSENYKLFPNLNILMQSDSQRSFPRNSVRCRTRGNPYINPQLKKQFMLRSFQCKKCPRYFKTPGYLKAHCAKVHNVN